MEAERLFIRRCEQAVVLMESDDEADLLDLAGLMRQLLMDKVSLLDTANRSRIKLRFHVGVSRWAANDPFEDRTFWTILDGLDPEIRAPGAPSALLTRDQFLKHVVANDHGNKITIKDIIEYAANTAGGVHHNPRPKLTPTVQLNQKVSIRGFEVSIYYLKGIAKIVLRALQPLIDDVKERQKSA